jgi:hypothetical protein
MKYCYNYSFLNRWMEANKDITNKQMMRAMGTTSNTCLDSWERMKSPLPTIALLRFCNAFHVPLSAFIVDVDASPLGDGDCRKMEYVCPGAGDQFEPDGGYLGNDAKRKLGTRALRDPLDVDRIKSVVPGWTSDGIAGNGGESDWNGRGKKKEREEEVGARALAKEENGAHVPDMGHGISMTTLNRMLDIIAEQQKQIGDQQKLIGELTRRLNSQQDGGNLPQAGYGMVAKELRHDE